MSIPVPERVIGSWQGRTGGPLLVVVAGMHGNEFAGIPASERVLAALARRNPTFRGELRVLAGNRTALGMGIRFADEDLNRIWLPGRLADPLRQAHRSREAAEQASLLAEVRRALDRAPGETCFLDLHTTSAAGGPFSVLADTSENRRLASALPGTMVLGLDEHLEGTFLNYINGLGFAAVGFEGGQHADPLAIDAHELAIWQTLTMLGCLEPGEWKPVSACRPGGRASGPRAVEVFYRHPVTPSDRFVMQPGFRNLQPVPEGSLLARDRRGEIRASHAGRLLMPLYQDQGEDGFFLTREIAPGDGWRGFQRADA
jgi:predicted deacylase